LRTVPQTKVKLRKSNIINKCDICSKQQVIVCDKCTLSSKVIDRFVSANIPVDFWDKEMDKFEGDSRLIKIFNSITKDNNVFKDYYINGKSMILVGQHGVGKTLFSCAILKQAVIRGYGALYTTLGDVVNVLIYGDSSTKFWARKELMMTDFLVLDEFDSRFINNENAAELFGRILESIIRIRFQNSLPTILISNDSDPSKALGANLGASVSSLITGFCKKISVTGQDFRTVLKQRTKE